MCPICKGINSQYCYRCKGALLRLLNRDNPWTCPICGHRPCTCGPKPTVGSHR